MELLDNYRKHCNTLKNKIENRTENEIIDLILTVSKFYFNLPFEDIIKKHILIDINQDEFLNDLKANNLSYYRDANQKSLEEINEYDPEYEEIDQIELSVLSGFSDMINENKKESLFRLFDGVITVLDYYEQFSERPQYWNTILEKELSSQIKLLDTKKINLKHYTENYKKNEFEEL